MEKQILKFKSFEKTWGEILNSPCDISVERILTGYVQTARADIVKTDDNSNISLPVYCFLIKHTSGYYLIDAGLDMSHRYNAYGMQKGLFSKFMECKATQDEGQSISEYLCMNKISLSGILLTHMHFDHIAGLADMPEYSSITISKNEPHRENKPFYYGDYLKFIKKMDLIDFKNAVDMPMLGKTIDFFGDGSLFVFDTYGHSKGHVSFLANSKSGTQIIAGDAFACNCDELAQNGPGKFTLDFDAAFKNLKNILKFKQEYPNTEIIYGHGSPNKGE